MRFSKPTSLELVPVVKCGTAKVDVVFVHGLDGDAMTTWRMKEPESWGQWISNDVPEANVWSLRYQLRSSNWLGGAMAISDRAVSVLALLDSDLTNKLPIVFICHSYGGLHVCGIVFFATPHNGSSIPNFMQSLDKITGHFVIFSPSIAISELRKNDSRLREAYLVQRKYRYFKNQSACIFRAL